MAAAVKKPVLVQLDMDYTEGGASPWFSTKGRAVVASLTSKPENAELFRELARDGTMGALVSYLDTEQPSASNVIQLCYILTALVLFTLFLLLPLAEFKLRHYTSAVGLIWWMICEMLLIVSASAQLHCLLNMISTWYGMDDGLNTKAPQAYEWTFELLRNYTQLTIQLLKEANDPDKNLDKALTTTTKGIKSLQADLSAWEGRFAGYASLKQMLTGPLAMVQMGLLGLAVAIAVPSALMAGGAWFCRERNLEKGDRSPVFVAVLVTAGAVLLLTHLAVVLPMIARWLPICVLAETYVCRPYRDGSFAVLDDGVATVWPPTRRPEPFCRLVPSTLFAKCSAKEKTGIKALPTCSEKSGKKAPAIPDTAAHVLQEAQSDSAAASKTETSLGDCFYPYKIIDTDLKSVCPLFTDDLLGYWMAMVLSAAFGMAGALAAIAIAVIFMAVGEEKVVKVQTKKRVVRKKRYKTKKEKGKKKGKGKEKESKASQTTPPPQLVYAWPQPINIGLDVPTPVPVRDMSRIGLQAPVAPFVVLQPHPSSPHSRPQPHPSSPILLQAPFLLPSPMGVPMVAPPAAPAVVASISGEQQQSAPPYTNINLRSGSMWTCPPSAGVALATPQLGCPAISSRRPGATSLLPLQPGGTATVLPQGLSVSVSTVSWSTDSEISSSESQVSVVAVAPSPSVLQQAVISTTQSEFTELKSCLKQPRRKADS
ncbi:hypothetical protein V5799_003251 [Amblyomma americanum]|uniref:Uncharacterized protein n=1 Tax=Amblyomma americanum TaxID=6943 RepID=A0AAQ4D9I6_AMBAM